MKTRSSRSTRMIALSLLCTLGSSGCFGTFSTLHKVYEWNRSVDSNKWAQWGVFAVTMIVPIYPSATIFDLIFTNSVEFWSGRNPMAAESTKTIHTETGEDVSLRLRDDGKVDVTVAAPGKPDAHFVVVPEGDVLAAYDTDGLAAIATPEAAPTH
jgi:uncharacterized protein DUF3332